MPLPTISDYEDKVSIAIHTCERFEVARVTVLSCLAFGGDVPILVQDDCSTDPRIDKWLTSLTRAGILMYLRSSSRIGIGRMYRWTADMALDLGEYVVSVDGDMLIGPDAIQLLYASLKHWEPDGVRWMSGFGLRKRRPEVIPDEEWVTHIGRYSDIALWVASSKIIHKYRSFISTVEWGQPLSKVRKHLMQDGFDRKLCLRPRIPVAHLGKFDSTVPTPGGSGCRCWFGCWEENPIPDLLDKGAFVVGYPQSAIDLGTRLRNEYLNRWDAIYSADRVVGIE